MTGTEIGVLFVCTGNQCRSPMAASLLRSKLQERGCSIPVESAGFLGEGAPPPTGALEAMWAVGIDLSSHRSRSVTVAEVTASALVVGMTRQHVIDLTLLAPREWMRVFTFADLLVRSELRGEVRDGETLKAWALRIGSGRTRSTMLALSLGDDISDPMGGRLRDYQRTRDLLSSLTDRLADLICPA